MDKRMNYKTCLHILLFTIFFTISFAAEKSDRNITLEVTRRNKGDVIRILDGDVKCNEIRGIGNLERSICKCSTKTPIFNVFLNHTYGCYRYKAFCQHQGCIARSGSFDQQLEQLTINVDITTFLYEVASIGDIGVRCGIHDSVRNTSVWNHSRWESISTNVNVNMKWETRKPVEQMKTRSGKELSGKLILFKMWCPRHPNPKINHVMIRLAGKETFTLLPQQLFEKTTMAPSKYNTDMTPSNADTAIVVPIVVVVVSCIVVALLVLLAVFRKKKKKKEKAAKKENMPGSHPPSGIDGNKNFSNGMYAEANSTYCEIDETNTLQQQQHRPQRNSYDTQCTEPTYSMAESKYYEIDQHQYSCLDTTKQQPEHYQALSLTPPVSELESQYEENYTADNAAHEEPIYFETEGTYYEAGTVLGKNKHYSDDATEKVKISVLEEYAVVDKSRKDNDRLSAEDEYSVVENLNKSREMHNNITGSDMENQESCEYNYVYEKHRNHGNNVGKVDESNGQ